MNYNWKKFWNILLFESLMKVIGNVAFIKFTGKEEFCFFKAYGKNM